MKLAFDWMMLKASGTDMYKVLYANYGKIPFLFGCDYCHWKMFHIAHGKMS